MTTPWLWIFWPVVPSSRSRSCRSFTPSPTFFCSRPALPKRRTNTKSSIIVHSYNPLPNSSPVPSFPFALWFLFINAVAFRLDIVLHNQIIDCTLLTNWKEERVKREKTQKAFSFELSNRKNGRSAESQFFGTQSRRESFFLTSYFPVNGIDQHNLLHFAAPGHSYWYHPLIYSYLLQLKVDLEPHFFIPPSLNPRQGSLPCTAARLTVRMTMGTNKAPACTPTWRGHIETTKDALMIFEACFSGALAHCHRRPHDRERSSLIVSGNVFVYEEATSGIKRWTDGIPWSPSRILTNFLIYRQLNQPFPPGEKKRATKRAQRPPRPGEAYPSSSSKSVAPRDDARRYSPSSPTVPQGKLEDSFHSEKDVNRGLLGSLVDSYEFKDNGLLKKTMTVQINGVHHHLVSYYSLEDAKHHLETPREDPRFKGLKLREELLNQPKFKFPNIDDAGDGSLDSALDPVYGYAAMAIPYDNSHRPLSVSTQGQHTHHEQQPVYFQSTGYVTQSPQYSSNQGLISPGHSSYAAVPSNPSTFMPMPSASSSFTPNQHNSNGHGQHSLPQLQHSTHQHSHFQGHHQHQQSTHTVSQGSQYPANQHRHGSAQQYSHAIPYSEATHSTFGSILQTGLPRPPYNFSQQLSDSFPATLKQEPYDDDYYGSSSTNVASGTESSVVLPQPWSAQFTARTEPQQLPYRA